MFVTEIAEIWDCMCQAEVMIPLKIVARSMYLSALEIHYFHERSAEVYDPRNPKTGAAFVFPDLEDLDRHQKESVKPKQEQILKLEGKMDALKRRMARESFGEGSKEYIAYHGEMRKIQLELIERERHLQDELEVAEHSSIIQLAVMWVNKWDEEFEPGYLAAISGDASVGQNSFKDVDWIQVSREYLRWGTTFVDSVEHDGRGLVASIADAASDAVSTVTNLSKIFSGDGRRRAEKSAQHKIFGGLADFVDYLDVIRNTIKLHDKMMVARNIKHWNGPHGVDLSNTIERSYQSCINMYNKTGKELLNLQSLFPQEVQDGFSSPNLIKAETLRTMAQTVQSDLIHLLSTAGMLGFFFPGSPMWETRRKLTEQGERDRSTGFFDSFKGADWGLVSASSMRMYVGKFNDDSTVEVRTPPPPLFHQPISERVRLCCRPKARRRRPSRWTTLSASRSRPTTPACRNRNPSRRTRRLRPRLSTSGCRWRRRASSRPWWATAPPARPAGAS